MSFIKVDINTNPIPEGVLEPKPFTNPSGGGGGGGGPVNFVVGAGSVMGDNSSAEEIPGNALDLVVLTFDKNNVGGKPGWGLLTIGSIIPEESPFSGQPHTLEGVLEIGAEPAPGEKAITDIGGQAIHAAQVPVTVQHLFYPTVAGVVPAKVLITNNLKWKLQVEPFTEIAAKVTLKNVHFTVLEI